MTGELLGRDFEQTLEQSLEAFEPLRGRIGESIEPKFGDEFLDVWQNDFDGYSAIVKRMGVAQ